MRPADTQEKRCVSICRFPSEGVSTLRTTDFFVWLFGLFLGPPRDQFPAGTEKMGENKNISKQSRIGMALRSSHHLMLP